MVAKGEESAEGAATEAARRAAAAVAAEAVGATDAAFRTGSPAERGGATKKPNGEAERSSRNNVEMERN